MYVNYNWISHVNDGTLGDILASNKKLLEDTQYHVRRIEYDILQNKREIKEYGEGTGDDRGDAHE